jgi:hypothetical protein
VAPQPADWFACLKREDGLVFVVFFTGDKVQDFRQPLGVDRCPSMDQPLPLAKAGKPK